jgi:RCC1 and BTB domain-containing protein
MGEQKDPNQGHQMSMIFIPSEIKSLLPYRVTNIGAGAYHLLCATDDQRVFGCGRNNKGQLGVGHLSDVPLIQPEELAALQGVKIKQIAGGWMHSLVLTVDGQCWAFGGSFAVSQR